MEQESLSVAARDFWAAFMECRAALARVVSADDPVYEGLLQKLQRVNRGLYFEFCAESGGGEFIVTADGDRALFDVARSVVALAPQVEGWSIRALKPRIGFPTTARWGDVTVNIGDLVFDPLELDGSALFMVRVYVPGLEEADRDGAHAAIVRAMDHGLGEERYAESIGRVAVRALREDVSASDFIPLVRLPDFIDWRERKRRARPQ
jgi:hypothetical protein